MDGFGFDHPSPDFGAEISAHSGLWGNVQLPWECNADDCADLTDILSSLHCLQSVTDINKPMEPVGEMSTPTTLDSVDSSTTAASTGSGWQRCHEHQKGDRSDAAPVAWLQSELGSGDAHLPETQLFSLPLNQLGQLGDKLSTLLSNIGNSATAAPVLNCSRKRARSVESSGEFEYSFLGGREKDEQTMAVPNQSHSFLFSRNQADGSSTTATTNSSPNCSGGDVNSIVLSDVLRWTDRLNSPAPSSGAGDDLKISLADHRPPPAKRPTLLLDQGASYTPSSLDFRRSTGRSGHDTDPEAVAKVKEMIYRAAIMRPVTLGREVAVNKPRRRNVRISSDPQTVAARERRERISDRLRVLQRLVPGGSKMDTATMLDEACNYLKFLKAQLAAGPKAARSAAGGKFGAAAGSSLTSRYPIPALQSRPGFPAPFETLVSRKSTNQYQNPSFPSTSP